MTQCSVIDSEDFVFFSNLMFLNCYVQYFEIRFIYASITCSAKLKLTLNYCGRLANELEQFINIVVYNTIFSFANLLLKYHATSL